MHQLVTSGVIVDECPGRGAQFCTEVPERPREIKVNPHRCELPAQQHFAACHLSALDHISDKDDCVTIVQAVTMMAQRLNMTTVAEGVETDAQRLKLTELGCTEMQGYLSAGPARPRS